MHIHYCLGNSRSTLRNQPPEQSPISIQSTQCFYMCLSYFSGNISEVKPSEVKTSSLVLEAAERKSNKIDLRNWTGSILKRRHKRLNKQQDKCVFTIFHLKWFAGDKTMRWQKREQKGVGSEDIQTALLVDSARWQMIALQMVVICII